MSQLINEAFKELNDIKDLDEELFSFDKKGASGLLAFLNADVEPTLNVIDPLATDEDEIQPNYDGNVICRCCVCNQLIYKDPKDIVIDEETQKANVDEECPHCYNIGGFDIVGQVEPYYNKEEANVEVNGDKVDIEEKEEISEGRKTKRKLSKKLNEAYDDEELDNYIGLKGTFRGFAPNELSRMYKSWNWALKRPMDPEELDDYLELKSFTGKVAEITDVNDFNKEEDPATTFNNSYWTIEIEGSEIAGVAGDRINLHGWFEESLKENLSQGYVIYDTEDNDYFIGLGRYPNKTKSIHSAIHFDTKEEAQEVIDDYRSKDEFNYVTEDRWVIKPYNNTYYEVWLCDYNGKRIRVLKVFDDLDDAIKYADETPEKTKILVGQSEMQESLKEAIDPFTQALVDIVEIINDYNITVVQEREYDDKGSKKFILKVNPKLNNFRDFNNEISDLKEDGTFNYEWNKLSDGTYEFTVYPYEVEEEEEEVLIKDVDSRKEAKKWLDNQLEKYGNTYSFPANVKKTLNTLINKFGNTYFWSREDMNEDTIKQGNKWVNKGKKGTHGTFRTKKAANTQRKAMYANGYKGESLKEDLEDVPDIVLEEDDIIFDDETGNIKVDKNVFDDFVKDSYIKISFDEGETYSEYVMIDEDDDYIEMEWLDGPFNSQNESLKSSKMKEDLVNKTITWDDEGIFGKIISENDPLTNKTTILVDGREIYINTNKLNKAIDSGRAIIESRKMKEDFNNIHFQVSEDDIKYFDDETGNILLSQIPTPIINKINPGDYVNIEFIDEDDVEIQQYKFLKTDDEGYKFEWVGVGINDLDEDLEPDVLMKMSDEELFDYLTLEKGYTRKEAREYINKYFNANLNEDFQKATVETGDSVLSMETTDEGKITVTSEPRKGEEGGEEMIAPVSDEVKAEIENEEEPSEEVEEKTEEETTEEESTEEIEETVEEEEQVEEEQPVEEETEESDEDIQVEEFEEGLFDTLGKKYLQEVYNNVRDFKTMKGYIDGNKIQLEGIITFNSGKQAKTKFLFEGVGISKRGKVKFIGENLQISNKKNAFTLNGSIENGKLLAESLTYNYRTKDASTNKNVRLYGTVRK